MSGDIHIRDIMQTDTDLVHMSKTTMCGRYDAFNKFTFGDWEYVMKKPKYYCHDCYNAWLHEQNHDSQELRVRNAVRIQLMKAIAGGGETGGNRKQRRIIKSIFG